MTQHDDAVGERKRFRLVMRDVDDRHAEPAMKALDFGLHLLAQVLVECGERLVEQQQLRLEDDRPRQGDALLLAAADLRWLSRT